MITSRDNATLKLVRKLLGQRKHRDETGLFAVEGEDLVDAARVAGVEAVHLLVAGESVEAELLAGVSTLPHPARDRGTGARTSRRRCATPASRSGGSPTRGTSARSSAPRMRSAPPSPSPTAAPTRCRRRRCARRRGRSSACRSSRGTPCQDAHGGPRGPRWRAPRGGGSHVAAHLPPRRRARGPRPTSHRASTITIPLPGEAESLNVAAAGAIALYEHARRGRPPG